MDSNRRWFRVNITSATGILITLQEPFFTLSNVGYTISPYGGAISPVLVSAFLRTLVQNCSRVC